jgi:large subunit ribosomal protein L13
MKTHSTKKNEIKREWHLIDLKGKILGRVSTEMAQLLIGKKKVNYVPYLDCGDNVVAINAAGIKVTGKKEDEKIYFRHSGYPGGAKELTFKQQMEKDPRKIIMLAVKNMLPKNKLRKNRLARLKVFVDDKHPYKDKFKESKQ